MAQKTDGASIGKIGSVTALWLPSCAERNSDPSPWMDSYIFQQFRWEYQRVDCQFSQHFSWVSITSSPRIKQNSITTHGQPYTNWQLNIETCQQIPRPNVDQLGLPHPLIYHPPSSLVKLTQHKFSLISPTFVKFTDWYTEVHEGQQPTKCLFLSYTMPFVLVKPTVSPIFSFSIFSPLSPEKSYCFPNSGQ